MNRILGIVIATVGALAALSLIFGTWYAIDQGERGIVLRNGVPVAVARPGLGFKLPLIDDVRRVSVRPGQLELDAVHAHARDGEPATLRLSVDYRLPAERILELYAAHGSLELATARAVRPLAVQHATAILGRHSALSVVRDRAALNAEIEDAVRRAVAAPLEVTAVRLESVAFARTYEDAVSEAAARAETLRRTAEAEAEAIRLRGEAEAGAYRARGAALAENPNLLRLQQMERWNGVLPLVNFSR